VRDEGKRNGKARSEIAAVTLSAASTADEVLAGLDLSGKQVVVTGGTSGLGLETARSLASAHAAVTIATRDLDRGRALVAQISRATGNRHVEAGLLDLSVPESVRTFADAWLERHSALHVLVNNAGVMACPLTRTKEGWELQLATNHLGHFLLTSLLSKACLAGAPSRIVNLTSGGHRASDVDFDDPHFTRRPYDRWMAYGQSKTANILFTVELNRRLVSSGVTANAVHPGRIVTNLGRFLTSEETTSLMARQRQLKSVAQGAATSVWAATSPVLAGRGGLYLEDCAIGVPTRDRASTHGYFEYAVDPNRAELLWKLSERTLATRFVL
jgi:NAD(P)-dependent dehydrogenase (short-subunit alcohol dehydrogenase family)